MILWIAVWILSAVLIFGFGKGFWKTTYEREGWRWSRRTARAVHATLIFCALFGPFGLGVLILANFVAGKTDAKRFAFCFVMPEALCEPKEKKTSL